MSECCKGKCWTKFLPHNWLCLKGLYVLFVLAFYVCVLFALYMAYIISTNPMVTGADMWTALVFYVGRALVTAVVCLTLSKIIKALCKIKKAVVPCCCETNKPAEEKKTKKTK